jgi:hypothetical protein
MVGTIRRFNLEAGRKAGRKPIATCNSFTPSRPARWKPMQQASAALKADELSMNYSSRINSLRCCNRSRILSERQFFRQLFLSFHFRVFALRGFGLVAPQGPRPLWPKSLPGTVSKEPILDKRSHNRSQPVFLRGPIMRPIGITSPGSIGRPRFPSSRSASSRSINSDLRTLM